MGKAKVETPEAEARRAAQRAAYHADPSAKAAHNAHVRHMRAAGLWSNTAGTPGVRRHAPPTRRCGECGEEFEHGGTARRYCPECRAKWADLATVPRRLPATTAAAETRPRCSSCTALLRPERGEPDEVGRCAACARWDERRSG